jgi:hypothetical protein
LPKGVTPIRTLPGVIIKKSQSNLHKRTDSSVGEGDSFINRKLKNILMGKALVEELVEEVQSVTREFIDILKNLKDSFLDIARQFKGALKEGSE